MSGSPVGYRILLLPSVVRGFYAPPMRRPVLVSLEGLPVTSESRPEVLARRSPKTIEEGRLSIISEGDQRPLLGPVIP